MSLIGPIEPRHYPQILRINEEFVDWLSPLDDAKLTWLLSLADYARQIETGDGILCGVLIGYPHDVDYPDHKNIDWLNAHLDRYFYIDRIIINSAVQGGGYGRRLYNDIENFARERGFEKLACEVNTQPDNPGSHRFHLKMGFSDIGEQDYPQYNAALRYYVKDL